MNCQEIKDLLAAKDNEIKLRNEKTYEYFDLVKDDVVDLLIKAHIDDEFKSEFYRVHEREVMEILYKKLGFDLAFFHWNYRYDSAWDSEYFSINNFEPFCAHSSHIRILCTENGIVSQELKDNLNEIKKEHEKVRDSFDYKMFGNLLVDYIKRKGFKQQVIIGQRSGREFKEFAFRIKRSQLENNCCESGSNIGFSKDEDVPSMENVIIGGVVAVIVIILGFLILLNLSP